MRDKPTGAKSFLNNMGKPVKPEPARIPKMPKSEQKGSDEQDLLSPGVYLDRVLSMMIKEISELQERVAYLESKMTLGDDE